MKINVRPSVGNDALEIDVEPEEKVECLKQKIAELRPNLPSMHQKLIYMGKVLADGDTLEGCDIRCGDCVIVYVKPSKKSAMPGLVPASTVPTSTPPPAPSPAWVPVEEPEVPVQSPETLLASTPTGPPQVLAPGAEPVPAPVPAQASATTPAEIAAEPTEQQNQTETKSSTGQPQQISPEAPKQIRQKVSDRWPPKVQNEIANPAVPAASSTDTALPTSSSSEEPLLTAREASSWVAAAVASYSAGLPKNTPLPSPATPAKRLSLTERAKARAAAKMDSATDSPKVAADVSPTQPRSDDMPVAQNFESTRPAASSVEVQAEPAARNVPGRQPPAEKNQMTSNMTRAAPGSSTAAESNSKASVLRPLDTPAKPKPLQTSPDTSGLSSKFAQASAKQSVEGDGFIECRDQDCFWYEDVEQMLADDIAACKLVCRRRGYGAFVVFNGVAYFRQQSAEECRLNLADTPGSTTYLNIGVEELAPKGVAAVDRLVDLGFDRATALEAFLACNCNEEIAANYLFDVMAQGEDGVFEIPSFPSTSSATNGISGPANFEEVRTDSKFANNTASRPANIEEVRTDSKFANNIASRPAIFEELRRDPKFPELAQLLAQNPQLLPQVTQALQQTHPGLQQALASNQVEFLKMVHEIAGPKMSPVNTMLAAAQLAAQGHATQAPGGLNGNSGPLGSGVHWEDDQWGNGGQWGGSPWANDGHWDNADWNSGHWGDGQWANSQWGAGHWETDRRPPGEAGLSAADQAAVHRLMGLGFPWRATVETYFLCGRSEEQTSRALVEGAHRLYTQ